MLGIWRKVQSCGLAVQFHEVNDFFRLYIYIQQVRRGAVLPLLPEEQVKDVWLEALEANDDDRQDVSHFKDYVTDTQVEGHLMNWNHFNSDGPRSTNAVAEWHHKCNSMCRRLHQMCACLSRFFFQKEQAANEAKMIQLAAGGVVRPK